MPVNNGDKNRSLTNYDASVFSVFGSGNLITQKTRAYPVSWNKNQTEAPMSMVCVGK